MLRVEQFEISASHIVLLTDCQDAAWCVGHTICRVCSATRDVINS